MTSAAPSTSAQPRKAKRARPANLSGVLDEIAAKGNHGAERDINLGDVLDAVGRRSYGPLLLVAGLIAVSPVTVIPGLSWVVAGLVFVIAGQMAVGRKRIWLPRAALKATFPRQALLKGLEQVRPWARRVDKLLKPRLALLSHPPFVNLVALACLFAAAITIPLSLIPIAPLAPSLAIVFFGLGMTAHDGLWLGLGLGLCGIAAWLVFPLLM